jgi:hypothetical protein
MLDNGEPMDIRELDRLCEYGLFECVNHGPATYGDCSYTITRYGLEYMVHTMGLEALVHIA